MAKQSLTFVNVFNLRDLGGYPTQDAGRIRPQRLFRSDDLSRLTADEGERFTSLGIRTVVDLRRAAEIAREGRILPFDGITYHHVQMSYPDWPRQEFADSQERAQFVTERYLDMCTHGGDCVGDVLRLIADASTAPLVFHCVAGKDRTGVIAALTLALLGVDDATIADDYQRSELAEPAAWAYLTRHSPELADKRWTHITVSPRAGMLGLLHAVRERHGSIEAYAASVGVTPTHLAAMRAHLITEPSPTS